MKLMKLYQARIHYYSIPSTTNLNLIIAHIKHTCKLHAKRGKSSDHGSNQVIKTILLSISLKLKSYRSSDRNLSLKRLRVFASDFA